MSQSKWRTAKVFISSTFRDMHAERDWLVKRVFPALRERLEQHRVYLDDIDLRWGVTEEQVANDQSLAVCLEQVVACHPFFVGILGERYGSLSLRIADDLLGRYPWIEKYAQRSITELEIRCGLEHKNGVPSRALFFFRDPSFVPDVPETKRVDVVSENEVAARQLELLKKHICDAPLEAAPEVYTCRYQGIRINWFQARNELNSEDQTALHEIAHDNLVEPHEYEQVEPRHREFIDRWGDVYVAGLESFGQMVQDRLWEAIQSVFQLPEDPHPAADASMDLADRLADETDLHDRFIESRQRIYVGRQQLQQELEDFVASAETRPCVVTGPSGSGKSAALARFVQRMRQLQPTASIIGHFVGASESSASIREMLGRLCLEMRSHSGLPSTEIPDTTTERITLFHAILAELADSGRVIIVIDGINQLDDADQAHELIWLPETMPSNVKILVSCLDDGLAQRDKMRVLGDRDILRLDVQPLTLEERSQIVRDVPLLSAKTLTSSQVCSLLGNAATETPLFLLVALEELRGYASIDQLDQRILDFPEGEHAITHLFIQVFERLEVEFDQTVVRTLLTSLAASRRGLSERELRDLTGDLSCQDDLFPVHRQLRSYLIRRGKLIHFFHQDVGKAIREKYWNSVEEEREAHRRLAEYFSRQPTSLRKADELPWQWQQCGDLDQLKESLIDLELFSVLQEQRPYELLGYWRVMHDCYDLVDCYEQTCRAYESNHEDADKKWNSVGQFFQTSGHYDAAQRALSRSLEIRKRERGEYHPDVAQCLNNLGVLAEKRGAFDEAETLMRRALLISTKCLGIDHLETGRMQNGLGMALYSQARFSEAEPCFRKSLEIRKRELGPEHAETAQALNNLAMTLQMLGDLDQAEELLRQALVIRQRALGKQHPDLAVGLNNLALLVDGLGRYDEAERLYLEALAITENVVGPAHPEHARSMQNLSIYYSQHDNQPKAAEFAERALAICQKAYGPNHPHTISALSNVAMCLRSQDIVRARSMLKDALDRSIKTQGPEHPNTAVSMINLAAVLVDPDDAAEALRLEREAFHICEQSGGWDLPQTSEVAECLARRLTELGEFAEAERLHHLILAHRERVFGHDHPLTVRSLNNVLELLRKYDPTSIQEELVRRAVDDNARVCGWESTETVYAVFLLVEFITRRYGREQGFAVYDDYAKRLEQSLGSDSQIANERKQCLAYQLAKGAEEVGDLDTAEVWYREELRVTQIARGPDSAEVAVSAYNLADLLQQRGRGSEAESLLRTALRINQATYGPNHPTTKDSMYDLACAISESDRDAAIDLLEKIANSSDGSSTDQIGGNPVNQTLEALLKRKRQGK